MACWSPALSLVLLLGLQLQSISGQGEIGFLLPCGEDNFSCPRIGNLSEIPLQCYTFDELCDGMSFCTGGSDEGNDITINSLECNLENQEFLEEPDFVCEPGNVVNVSALCDGVNDCGQGGDETTTLCETTGCSVSCILYADKCRLPYYGGCPYTRECITTEFDVNCGDCLPGFMEDPDSPGLDCIPIPNDCPEEYSDTSRSGSQSSRSGSRSSRSRYSRRSRSSRRHTGSSSSTGCRKKTRTSPRGGHTTPRGRPKRHSYYWARVLRVLYNSANN